MASRDSAPSEYDQSEYEDERSRNEADRAQGSTGSGSGQRWAGVFLLFIAFGLMAVASATPITKDFYIFYVKIAINALIDKVTNEFRFGVWGYCSTGVKNSFGIGKAKINSKVTGGGCENRKLGWTFKDIPGMSDETQDAISASLTGAFVLHVVAAFFIFLALVATIIGAAKRDRNDTPNAPAKSRKIRGAVFAFVLISFIFSMTVFILDTCAVLLTKKKVHKKSKGIAKLGFGPAYFFVCAAFGVVLFALIIAIVDFIKAKKRASYANNTVRNQPIDRRVDPSDSEYDDVPVTPVVNRKEYY